LSRSQRTSPRALYPQPRNRAKSASCLPASDAPVMRPITMVVAGYICKQAPMPRAATTSLKRLRVRSRPRGTIPPPPFISVGHRGCASRSKPFSRATCRSSNRNQCDPSRGCCGPPYCGQVGLAAGASRACPSTVRCDGPYMSWAADGRNCCPFHRCRRAADMICLADQEPSASSNGHRGADRQWRRDRHSSDSSEEARAFPKRVSAGGARAPAPTNSWSFPCIVG
jgi:hypothetical protein